MNFRVEPLVHEFTRGKKVQDKLVEERRFFSKGNGNERNEREEKRQNERESHLFILEGLETN